MEIEEVFKQLGRTEKCDFISRHIDMANAHAVAEYVKAYLFDILRDVKDDEYIATYLRERGYEIVKTNFSTQ